MKNRCRFLFLIFSSILVSACSGPGTEPVPDEPESVQRDTTVSQDTSDHSALSERKHAVLDSLIALLVHDNYLLEIDTVFDQPVNFRRSRGDTLKVPCSKLITIRAKRKDRMPGPGDNYFPSFNVRWMSFPSGTDVQNLHERIERVIHQKEGEDMLNEYTYDEAEVCGNEIFYISTHAMVFSEFVSHYDKEFKRLLNQ